MRQFLIAALLLAGAQPSIASPALDKELSALIAKRPLTPGLAYAVVESDGSVTTGAVGISNVETSVPLNADMLLRPGSTTKMMVAAALLQAMHVRGMSPSTKVGTIAPDAHSSLHEVTVHHLLSMTAPLVAGTKNNGPLDDEALAVRVKSGADLALFDKRIGIYSYSNGAYDLAGYLLERLVGKAFPDAMKEVLFTPAGMTKSFYRPLEAATYPISQGHEPIAPDKAAVVRPWPEIAAERPSGTLFTNVGDFARFIVLLRNDGASSTGQQVLAAEVVRSMLRTYVSVPTSKLGGAYGYGIFYFEADGRKLWYHGGGNPGFVSDALLVPSEKIAIVVITNGQDSILKSEALSLIYQDRTGRPLSVDLWGPFAPWTGNLKNFKPIPRALSNALVGRWGQPLNQNPPFDIKKEGEELVIYIGEQKAGMLRWLGGNHFIQLNRDRRPLTISLTCGKDGAADYITYRIFALPRLPKEGEAVPRCIASSAR